MDRKRAYLYAMIRPIAKLALHSISRARLPKIQGTVQIKGLHGPVEILRDRWHVPHIYAATTADVLFGQGYVHAQERLWQMDFNRRVVCGRLSEILGEAGLGADKVMRTLGFRRIVEEEAVLLPEAFVCLSQSYCAGVNAWMETAHRSHKLPIEFSLLGYEPEPWQPADMLGWTKLMSWTLAANWESEFLRGQLVERLGAEKAAELEIAAGDSWAAVLDAASLTGHLSGIDPTGRYTGAKAAEGVGSNNWVIHGSRTTTGKPILANDMHMDLTAPAIWFENHLASPDLEVTGISIPGIALVIAGHNRHLAWGFTDGIPDVQDLYEEHIRATPAGGTEYEYMGQWYPADVRQEEIRVKGAPAVKHEVVATRHGPLINLLFQQAYPSVTPLALRWTALDHETTFQAFYAMNAAHSCAEFHQALRYFSGPAQNVVYADVLGNIGYTLNGRVPVRAQGDGSVPVPGWTGAYEWLGSIHFEAMPHMDNPARGFIATANNVHDRAVGDPCIGRDYMTADRAARITALIEAQPKIDIAYIQKMHTDQVSISARVFARYAACLKTTDPVLQAIIQQMQSWDGSLAPDSALAAVFEAAIRQALHLILAHQVGDLAVHVQGKGPATGAWSQHSWEWLICLLDRPDSPWFDLGHGEQRDDVLIRAMHLAVEYLKQELGPDWKEWRWGRLHTLTFRHILGSQELLAAAFNLGPSPIGGDGTTIWASFTHYYDLGQDNMGGPPFRFIADLSDLDHCWGILVPGQSGNPASPAYCDGIQPWYNGSYHPMLFRREEIEQNLSARLELVPTHQYPF